MGEKGFLCITLEMPHSLQTEKCHDGEQADGKSQVKEGSSGRFILGEQGPAQDAEVKGLRENGQDVEDGQDPG